MIKKLADKYTIVFSFVVTLVIMATFLASMFLFASIFNVDLTNVEPTTNFFTTSILGKIVFAALTIFLLIKVKMQSVMRLSSKGLLKGFALGWFPILLGVLVFLMKFDFSKIGSIEQNKWVLLLFLAGEMLLTGITEEFLCRGLLYNTVFNKYNNVKIAVLFSSAIFGVVHLICLIYQPLIVTLVTVVFAFAGGVLFAAIYARCKNIWVVVLIHAFWDIAMGAAGILTPSDTISTNVASGTTAEIIAQAPSLVVAILFVCLGMFLIRKKKLELAVPNSF